MISWIWHFVFLHVCSFIIFVHKYFCTRGKALNWHHMVCVPRTTVFEVNQLRTSCQYEEYEPISWRYNCVSPLKIVCKQRLRRLQKTSEHHGIWIRSGGCVSQTWPSSELGHSLYTVRRLKRLTRRKHCCHCCLIHFKNIFYSAWSSSDIITSRTIPGHLDPFPAVSNDCLATRNRI